jgi:hypothetical protein
MALAGAAVAQCDHVLPPLDVLAAGELQHQHLVQRRDRCEVEAVQALDRREAGLADAPLDQPSLAIEQLELGQAEQVGRMVGAFRSTLPRQLIVLAQEGRQLERLEVVRQQHLRQVAHVPIPRSRVM